MAQLTDLVKPIEEMSEEELKQRLYDLRHRREVVRPAAKARAKKVQWTESKKVVKAAEKLLDNLSAEELEALIIRAQGTEE